MAEAKRKSKDQEDHERLIASARSILQTAQGRQFVWWLLSECGIYRQNTSANSTMYIMEGQRSIGLKVIDLLGQVSPVAYPELILERAQKLQASRVVGEEKPVHVTEDSE